VQRQISYKCDKCSDTGWILIKQENRQPLAVSCECRKVEKLKNEWKYSGINVEQSKLTFASFEVWNEASQRTKDTAIAYYQYFHQIRSSRKNSILFCGQVGSGKTHCSIALALNFLKQKIKIVYMPYRDVITKIKQNMIDQEYYSKIISKYQLCEVLLIDDLFKGKINESDINIMFEIINYRYLNFLPIIISSEFSVDRLLAFDEGVGSRIYEMSKDYVVGIGKDISNNYRLK
jgi:DNA replication protein DnaC